MRRNRVWGRLFTVLLAMMLSVAFSGCKGEAVSGTDGKGVQEDVQNQQVTSSPVEATPLPEALEESEEHPGSEEVPEPEPCIQNTYEKGAYEGLYEKEMKLLPEGGAEYEAFAIGGSLIVKYYDYETLNVYLGAVDILSGDVKKRAFEVDEYGGLWSVAVYPSGNDRLEVYEDLSGEPSFYDLDLNPVSDKGGAKEEDTASSDLPNISEIEDNIENCSKLCFSPDGRSAIVTMAYPYYGIYLYRVEEAFAAPAHDSEHLAAAVDFKISEGEEVQNIYVDWKSGELITYTWNSQPGTGVLAVRVYDLSDGCFKKSMGFAYDPSGRWPDLFFFEDLAAVGMLREGETDTLTLWVYDEGTGADLSELYLRQDHLPETVLEERSRLEEKYDFHIYLGAEALTIDVGYKVLPSYSETDIMKAFSELDETLALYPDGLFEQLRFGYVKNLGIAFCDSIEKSGGNQVDVANAVSSVSGFERVLVLDISIWDDIRTTLVHEISHWIDGFIEDKAAFGEMMDFEDGFALLNPSDFSYVYDYSSGDYDSRYTYCDPEELYFIDAYSQTYPTEDRARIFENLMPEADNTYFESAHLREKAAYYFEAIREAFDTEGWSEQTEWEKNLAECMKNDEIPLETD